MAQTLDGILQVPTGAIDANSIAADAIGASELAANAIGASELADDAIDAATFAVDVGQWRHVQSNYNFTDDGGTQIEYALFTVTGDVLLTIFGICQVLMDSAGAADISAGIVGAVTAFMATTTATALDQYETWQDAGPEANPGVVDVFGGARQFVIANGVDIVMDVDTADLTAGDIDFHVFWMPLSSDGALVAV